MSRKKALEAAEAEEQTAFDLIIVGASAQGLAAALAELAKNPSLQIVCLEAHEKVYGRAASGLHLAPEGAWPESWKHGPTLQPARVRWDRQWMNPEQVDWTHKDWRAKLPQWDLYLGRPLVPLTEVSAAPENITIKKACPVRALKRDENGRWLLQTPTLEYSAPRVIWAAGLAAFQNAYGKTEANACLAPNPDYSPVAADYRGGMALTVDFEAKPVWQEGFPEGHVFALPVRHNGAFSLMLGAFFHHDGKWRLQTLTHMPQDFSSEPADLLHFQKSLRRGLKGILAEGVEITWPAEQWVVSDRVGGHNLGAMWLLKDSLAGLHFVGDETLTAPRDIGAAYSLRSDASSSDEMTSGGTLDVSAGEARSDLGCTP